MQANKALTEIISFDSIDQTDDTFCNYKSNTQCQITMFLETY